MDGLLSSRCVLVIQLEFLRRWLVIEMYILQGKVGARPGSLGTEHF